MVPRGRDIGHFKIGEKKTKTILKDLEKKKFTGYLRVTRRTEDGKLEDGYILFREGEIVLSYLEEVGSRVFEEKDAMERMLSDKGDGIITISEYSDMEVEIAMESLPKLLEETKSKIGQRTESEIKEEISKEETTKEEIDEKEKLMEKYGIKPITEEEVDRIISSYYGEELEELSEEELEKNLKKQISDLPNVGSIELELKEKEVRVKVWYSLPPPMQSLATSLGEAGAFEFLTPEQLRRRIEERAKSTFKDKEVIVEVITPSQ